MTQDVLLTLSLLLGAALAARFLASVLRIPEILLLVAFGALLGPSVVDVVDVPLDSIGAQLLFTLGVSLILFYGGLNLSLDVLQRVRVGLGMLVIPGVLLTALITGAVAHFAFDLSWTAALLMGAVLAPTDPAILIPLFVRSRLRTKVAQTVVAESAFNDPTGAVLALTLAGVLLTGDDSIATPGGGVRRRPRDQHRDRHRRGRAARGDDLEPAGRHLARVVGRGGARCGHDRLLLARLRRRQRLSGGLPRRPDRREHGAPRAWRCIPTTSASCASSPSTSPTW